MCVQNKILVLFLALFCHRFGSIILKLPGAKLQLTCFHMVYVCRHRFADRWQVGGLVETVDVLQERNSSRCWWFVRVH